MQQTKRNQLDPQQIPKEAIPYLTRTSELDKALQSNQVDICIVIDGTVSMGGWIRKTKESISKIFKEAQKEWKQKIDIRFAVVVYRDWEDGQIQGVRGDHLEILDFTYEVDKATEFVDNVIADGGNDVCEVFCSPFPCSLPPAYGTQKRKGCLGRLTSDPKFKLAIGN